MIGVEVFFLNYTHGRFTGMYMIAGGNDDILLHFSIEQQECLK